MVRYPWKILKLKILFVVVNPEGVRPSQKVGERDPDPAEPGHQPVQPLSRRDGGHQLTREDDQTLAPGQIFIYCYVDQSFVGKFFLTYTLS